MPNRKTFDMNDRYDHSSHSTREQEEGDLQATPQGTADMRGPGARPTRGAAPADADLFHRPTAPRHRARHIDSSDKAST